MSGGKREGAGRKPLIADDVSVVGSVRLTPALWIKFKQLGGVTWLRAALTKARLPK